MIKGLDVFREHFIGMDDQYILIGGAACDIQVSSPHATCRSGHLRGVTIMTHSVHCRFATESYFDRQR